MVTERDLEEPLIHILERDLASRLTHNSPDVQVRNTARGQIGTGQWRQPDVVLTSISRYLSRHAPELALYGFELKLANNCDVSSVYQALAYTRFVHYSYLVVYHPLDEGWSRLLSEVGGHASEIGVGLIRLLRNSKDSGYDVVMPARKFEPQPYNVDQFISEQMSDLVNWVRQRMSE